MSLRDQNCRESGVQGGCIVKLGRSATVAHRSSCNEQSFFRGAAVIAVNFSKFGSVSEKNHGESLDDSPCFCSFEKTVSAGRLVDLRDAARP